ncbi:MAG: stage II sporulation protein R [Defluviitaleaceae bacterium]|nr:stage II sporulation protein R [Defluviitaleaceae bacterium]
MKRIIEWLKKNKVDMFGAVVVGLAGLFLFSSVLAAGAQGGDISNHVLRLHIMAADDSPDEIELKLALRDELWQFLSELTEDARTQAQAREIVRENIELIEDEAWFILQELGSEHIVTARLLRGLNFPAMMYGTIMLPQGDYEALQIIIGDGAGGNWWCIMFPAMCLMDITRGETVEQDGSTVNLRPRLRISSLWSR